MYTRTLFILLLVQTIRSEDRLRIHIEMDEEQPIGSIVTTLPSLSTIRGRLGPDLSQLRFYPVNSMCSPFLEVDEFNGSVTVTGRIDKESICQDTTGICMLSCSVDVIPTYLDLVLEVVIKDINDNAPTFPVDSIFLNLTRHTLVSTKFALPPATDDDSYTFGVSEYQLIPGSDRSAHIAKKFKVDRSQDGLELRLVDDLNDPLLIPEETYSFNVIAKDRGTPPLQCSLKVNVKIMADNNNDPRFSSLHYEASVSEDSPEHFHILNVSATDLDAGENGKVAYKLLGKNHPFIINEATGLLSLRSSLDREKVSRYSLTVEAEDSGKPSRSSSATISITVLDVNDNRPSIFVTPLGTGPLVENLSPPIAVAIVAIKDEDSEMNGFVKCFLEDETDSFAINSVPNVSKKTKNVSFSNTNKFYVYSTAVLDSEISRNLNLTLTCHDNPSDTSKMLDSSVVISVNVIDANDNDPVFSSNTYSMTLIENMISGTYVGEVMATDVDEGLNARVTYSLLNDSSNFFSINSSTGVIRSLVRFDREVISSCRFKVVATDGGSPSRSSTATVIVDILDVNDNLPMFLQSEYVFPVAPSTKPGIAVGSVTAVDQDEGQNAIIHYKIRKDPKECSEIAIDSKNGSLSLTHTADATRCKVHNFYVEAKNPILDESSSTQVVVFVKEETDVEPTFIFPKQFENNSVIVQYPFSKDQEIAKLSVKSIDSEVKFSLSKIKFLSGRSTPKQSECEDKMFALDSTTGSITLLDHPCLNELDQSHNSTFELTVRACVAEMTFLRTESTMKISFANLPTKTVGDFDWARMTSNPNLLIVVAIVACTVVLVVALSSVIISLVMRSRKKKGKATEGKYSCCKMNGRPPINTTFMMGGGKSNMEGRREQVVSTLLQESRSKYQHVPSSSASTLCERDSQSSDSGRGPSENDFQFAQQKKHSERSTNRTPTSSVRPSYDPLNEYFITPTNMSDNPIRQSSVDFHFRTGTVPKSKSNHNTLKMMMAPSEDFDQLEAQTTTGQKRVQGRRDLFKDSKVKDEPGLRANQHHQLDSSGHVGSPSLSPSVENHQGYQCPPHPFSTISPGHIHSKKVSFDVAVDHTNFVQFNNIRRASSDLIV